MSRAWIELDKKALWNNVKVLQTWVPKECRLMPVLKANAYGHGDVLLAWELNQMGIEDFCVATVEEGVRLRENGILGEILVLGYTSPFSFSILRHHQLTQTVVDYAYAKELNDFGQEVKVHVAVDTGMHRLGESYKAYEHIKKIFAMENLRVEGIFSHLCVGDSSNKKDREYSMAQNTALCKVVSALEKDGYSGLRVHLLSSYGMLNYAGFVGNYARVGIALYGMLSTKADTDKYGKDLRPVLSVKARIATVKKLKKGEGAGYGLQFVASRESKIAVVTIGYADGLPRSLSGGVGKVLVRGKMAEIVGRVCMDQLLIDVTEIEDVQGGDVATIIGTSGKFAISACDIAEQIGTITNEIFSRLGQRLERVWAE